jgi:hypothetical protein
MTARPPRILVLTLSAGDELLVEHDWAALKRAIDGLPAEPATPVAEWTTPTTPTRMTSKAKRFEELAAATVREASSITISTVPTPHGVRGVLRQDKQTIWAGPLHPGGADDAARADAQAEAQRRGHYSKDG